MKWPSPSGCCDFIFMIYKGNKVLDGHPGLDPGPVRTGHPRLRVDNDGAELHTIPRRCRKWGGDRFSLCRTSHIADTDTQAVLAEPSWSRVAVTHFELTRPHCTISSSASHDRRRNRTAGARPSRSGPCVSDRRRRPASTRRRSAPRPSSFSLILMPVLMGGSGDLPLLLRNKVDTKDKIIAPFRLLRSVYDRPWRRGPETQRSATSSRANGPGADRPSPCYRIQIRQSRPRHRDGDAAPFRTHSEEQIRTNHLASVVIGADVVRPGADPAPWRPSPYHSNSPTYDDVQKWLIQPINDAFEELRLAESRLDAELVARVTRRRRGRQSGHGHA